MIKSLRSNIDMQGKSDVIDQGFVAFFSFLNFSPLNGILTVGTTE